MVNDEQIEMRLKNLDGILQEFDDIYPEWETVGDIKQCIFCIEWDQAVGSIELLQRTQLTLDQQSRYSIIFSQIQERIPKLVELQLLLPQIFKD